MINNRYYIQEFMLFSASKKEALERKRKEIEEKSLADKELRDKELSLAFEKYMSLVNDFIKGKHLNST